MEGLLLSVHVLAGIIFVGGSAVAASLFPRYAPVAVTVPAGAAVGSAPAEAERSGAEPAGERNVAVAALLHRITRGYGIFAVVVPVLGIVLAIIQGRMAEIWLNIAMLLTLAAGLLLALVICPRQKVALAEPDDGSRLRSLSMYVGIYNVLWAVVVVLMIVRPGAY